MNFPMAEIYEFKGYSTNTYKMRDDGWYWIRGLDREPFLTRELK
jgi:hypothetical protein